jgi:hypothetical protein
VNRHGVGCAGHTCGNPRLQQFVLEQGLRAGIPVPALEGFREAMERATHEAIDAGAGREEAFARQNDAQMAARLESVPMPARTMRALEGYVMNEERRDRAPRNEARATAPVSEYAGLWASLPVLALLVAWRWKHRATHR